VLAEHPKPEREVVSALEFPVNGEMVSAGAKGSRDAEGRSIDLCS